jgi:hypothetical protein
MLPLEQILSQVAGEAPRGAGSQPATPTRSSASPSSAPAGGGPSAPRQGFVSPFEADRARKGRSFEPEMSAAPQPQTQVQVASAAATAVAEAEIVTEPGTILGHVLLELEKAGHKMLASTLEGGTVAMQGNELTVTISRPASVIELMMGPEPRRVANSAASAAAGRPLKVNVVSGAPPANGAAVQISRPRDGASARSRAAEDPVVRRMQEKFGAEIRTVIDHRAKN